MGETFLIVDGNSLMHRAFHALPLMDADGIYTNAIYGFLSMLLKLIREENAQYLAICFDEHGPTFRHQIYAEYKAGRAETAPELRQQFETVLGLLDEMKISRFSCKGWEADDLLGTLSKLGQEQGVHPLLLTGDRDALQLVSDQTELMFTRKGISETTRFTPAKVEEEYGFRPDQVTDWKGMAGDASDHIPGITGVGDKTAVKLLQEYGTLENVLENADKIKGKLGQKIADGADQAIFCKKLATIRRDAPVSFDLEACRVPDFLEAIPALQKLKLQSLVKRIEENAGAGAGKQASQKETEKKQETDEVPGSFGDNGNSGQAFFQLQAFQNTLTLQNGQELSAWLGQHAAEDTLVAIWQGASSFSLSNDKGQAAEIPLGSDLLSSGMDPYEVLKTLSGWMQAGRAIVHDGKKWLHQLQAHELPLPDHFAWDTMLGAYVLDPGQKSYLLKDLYPEQEEGAKMLLSVCLYQRNRLSSLQMMDLMQNIEMPLSFVLFRMEKAGFSVDTEFLRQLGKNYETEIAACRQRVIDACGGTAFNLNSPQQLSEVLFERMKLPHGKKTARGYSTSVEVLEELRFEAPQIIEPLLRYRQLMKLNGTYVEGLVPLVDRQGRVHSYFDQTGTATGRISSSEPNLQNIPVRTEEGKEIRRAFLPQEGWILVDADYSQIELRLMAHFSGDAAMLDAFRKGEDIHARTASEIFDVPPEWVTPELRSRAKAVNFGLIYGISEFGLSKNTGVSRREAADFIQKYFQKYPGAKRFMEEAAAQGMQNGYTQTLMGRRRYLPELQSSKAMVREFGKRVAMNTPIQGTAADIIKLAMVKIDQELRANQLKSRLILQVHDELLLECPPEEVESAAALLKRTMEEVISLQVPLLAEVHQGTNWAEAK